MIVKVSHPVGACGDGVLSLEEDCKFQSCRFGGLEDWTLEIGLEPWRLVGLLAGRVGLDWSDC